MVSVLVSTAVDRGFEPLSDQTKDYKIGICCDNHTSLWSKNKDNLAEWSDISIADCCCSGLAL